MTAIPGEAVLLSEPLTTPAPLRFGDDFQLDLRSYELRRTGRRLKLERIPMDLLVLLVEKRGQLVTREEIVERVWGKDVFLDTDNSINAAIRKIRQVLKDDPERPRFVQTVTGRGYRFIAPVKSENGAASGPEQVVSPRAADKDPAPKPNLADGIGRLRTYHLGRLLLAVIIIVFLAGGTYFQWFRRRAHPPVSTGRVMLAVLPFQNLTGDSTQEYFSDGLTEEMITQLGSLDAQHLGVIGRTSVMLYKQSPKPLNQIGHELGVQYLIEGSVRRDSDRVRITAQLIQVNDQTHVWAKQYDRELASFLNVQGEIAQEVADEIQLRLGDRHQTGAVHAAFLAPSSYEAYDLYLRGLYLCNKRPEGLDHAADYFQQAIAKDPNYARAYAGLANTYGLMSTWSRGPQSDLMPKARAAAIKALQLDPNLAEAHAALALITESYDYDWATAEREFRRALELEPNYTTAHQWYGEYLSWMGRFDEALAESERARLLDPLSLVVLMDRVSILLRSHQYDRALAENRIMLDRDPNFPGGWVSPPIIYVAEGRFQDALDHVNKYIRPTNAVWAEIDDVTIYSKWGRTADAQEALAKFKDLVRRMPVHDKPVNWLPIYIALGDKDQAIALLERAASDHSHLITGLKVDPLYDPLRGDPRFQALLRKVGLAQ